MVEGSVVRLAKVCAPCWAESATSCFQRGWARAVSSRRALSVSAGCARRKGRPVNHPALFIELDQRTDESGGGGA